MENVMSILGGVLMIALAGAGFAFWVYSLVDVVRIKDDTQFRAGTQVIWVLVIAITGLVGSIVYFLFGRPRKRVAVGTV